MPWKISNSRINSNSAHYMLVPENQPSIFRQFFVRADDKEIIRCFIDFTSESALKDFWKSAKLKNIPGLRPLGTSILHIHEQQLIPLLKAIETELPGTLNFFMEHVSIPPVSKYKLVNLIKEQDFKKLASFCIENFKNQELASMAYERIFNIFANPEQLATLQNDLATKENLLNFCFDFYKSLANPRDWQTTYIKRLHQLKQEELSLNENPEDKYKHIEDIFMLAIKTGDNDLKAQCIRDLFNIPLATVSPPSIDVSALTDDAMGSFIISLAKEVRQANAPSVAAESSSSSSSFFGRRLSM